VISTSIGFEDLVKASDKLARAVLSDATAAVHFATRGLEKELEELTREAVPGRLWRAWRSELFPRRIGPARAPAGTVFVNGGARSRGAMEFYSQPGQIRGSRGQWLAIPTPAAGSRGRARNLTPGEWEARTGTRLRFVYRGGRRSALLVADMGTTNARTGTYRRITRKRTAADDRRGFLRGEQTVVIFVLIPMVSFANRFAVEPTIARWGQKLEENFVSRGRL
jgi:hypothetical protein